MTLHVTVQHDPINPLKFWGKFLTKCYGNVFPSNSAENVPAKFRVAFSAKFRGRSFSVKFSEKVFVTFSGLIG